VKKLKLFIIEPAVNKVIGRELNFSMDDKATLIDVINETDKIISSKGGFPVPHYQSLLHMVYNPVKNRFYKQVAITAYDETGQTLNIRDDPKRELPTGITITLIPAGGCISEWEEAISYEEFLKALLRFFN